MTRRRFTEREVLECLILQGAVIPCKRCRVALKVEDARASEREHLHEVGLDGPDTIQNCAYSHGDCHKTITHGNGATFAGSSRHKIAKATQPKRIEKFIVNKIPLDADIVGEPSGRCPRCGEDREYCQCPAPSPRRSAFANARRT